MIDILYFARVREALGLDREQLDLVEDGADVAALITQLCSNRDSIWREILNQDNLLIAVNQTMVGRDSPVTDGDEIAFFPPVSGG